MNKIIRVMWFLTLATLLAGCPESSSTTNSQDNQPASTNSNQQSSDSTLQTDENTLTVPESATAPATESAPATEPAPSTEPAPATEPTPATESTPPISVKIGKFSASYYNDGVFIDTETVARPAINYINSNFKNIPSDKFGATWAGDIEVLSDMPRTIDINFDVSWSDVSLTIDGSVVEAWSNSNKSISYTFSKGTHSIIVEYRNHWHTVGFNASFTNNIEYSTQDAIPLIQNLLVDAPVIVYLGAYEPSNLYNFIQVTLAPSSSSVILFLSSYAAANWIINNPNNVDIKGVVYSAYAPRPVVITNTPIPTIELETLHYGYNDFTAPTQDIITLTGAAPDYVGGQYSLGSVVISIP
jgi:hypothetical protein